MCIGHSSDETNLNIHIYGVEDWTPPEISEISYHTEEATRFEPYWVLAYDGGPDENQACGLVAKEYFGRIHWLLDKRSDDRRGYRNDVQYRLSHVRR